ncbi:MAG: hypothetical protein METHP_01629 [Methanoregula sp. SKADARSKE-2]|nr:MAG: hypothetical protein METHP_01629 [Methanoregula sp. SKADARSKE-2]
MKLTGKEIRWIIRQKERQESSGIIAKIQRVTRRRGDQLAKHYRETGIIPGIGEALGRPKKPITAEESGVIANASGRFSVWSENVRDANRGSEYGAHRINQDGNWEREFKQYLESMGIRPIPTRARHSQTKGKSERWFDTYRRSRYEFASLDDFISWYNDRPHGSLDFENLESPNLAFWRRLPQRGYSRFWYQNFWVVS